MPQICILGLMRFNASICMFYLQTLHRPHICSTFQNHAKLIINGVECSRQHRSTTKRDIHFCSIQFATGAISTHVSLLKMEALYGPTKIQRRRPLFTSPLWTTTAKRSYLPDAACRGQDRSL